MTIPRASPPTRLPAQLLALPPCGPRFLVSPHGGRAVMCARLGMVTGEGLAAVVRKRFPAWVLWGACLLLSSRMSSTSGRTWAAWPPPANWSPASRSAVDPGLTPCCSWSLVIWTFLPRHRAHFQVAHAGTVRLCVAAFLARPDWGQVLRATGSSRVWNGRKEYLSVLVAIFGTTISPYLFFWQAAQEVEEEKADRPRPWPTPRRHARRNCAAPAPMSSTGMFFSNLVMYFIILTSAATLHAHGMTHIAPRAMRPKR